MKRNRTRHLFVTPNKWYSNILIEASYNDVVIFSLFTKFSRTLSQRSSLSSLSTESKMLKWSGLRRFREAFKSIFQKRQIETYVSESGFQREKTRNKLDEFLKSCFLEDTRYLLREIEQLYVMYMCFKKFWKFLLLSWM